MYPCVEIWSIPGVSICRAARAVGVSLSRGARYWMPDHVEVTGDRVRMTMGALPPIDLVPVYSTDRITFVAAVGDEVLMVADCVPDL